MPKTVAQLRSEEHADCAYALFIEGLPYVWVTPHSTNGTSESLLGSGISSWIGIFENAVAHETVGQRQVLRGLVVPDGLKRGQLNRKTGLFESTGATFELIDHDGILGDLFANEGKTEYELGQRLPPDQDAAPNPLLVFSVAGGTVGPAASIDPAGYNVGIERIGPARERRYFMPLPVEGIGLHHQVNGTAQDETVGPAPIPVTSSPTVFAGRMVCLYRLYRDTTLADSAAGWPRWDLQYEAGGPEWMGVLRDQGEYLGDGTWRLDCWGPESLLRRQLGTIDGAGWMPVASVDVALSDEQRGIAIGFAIDPVGGGAPLVYPSRAFGTVTLSATGAAQDFFDEVQTAIYELADGTAPGDFSSGISDAFLDHDLTGTGVTPQNGIIVQHDAWTIRRPLSSATPGFEGRTFMMVCLHEIVWRLLGFEPQTQSTPDPDPSEPWQLHGNDKEAGQSFWLTDSSIGIFSPGGGVTPGPGYWTLTFDTRGEKGNDNDGDPRVFEPIHTLGESSIFSAAGDQDFTISASFPYVEGDPTVDRDSYDRARFWLFRGKRTKVAGTQLYDAEGNVLESETEDEAQVAIVQWDEGSGYGSVAEPAGVPALHIKRWIGPRRFGIDRPRFQGEWNSEAGGEFTIECKPLQSLAYYEDPGAPDIERASGVLLALLYSTGGATPWTGGAFVAGLNDGTWDRLPSELGLGVPATLINDDISAFEDVPGGLNGGFNSVRYAYAESFSSWDVIADIIQPRALALSLEGGRFGVVRLALPDPADAAITLTENDAYGSTDDPRDVTPVQQLRATGAIDETVLDVRHDPSAGAVLEQVSFRARDNGARHRRGDLVQTLPCHGLLATHFFPAQVVPAWYEDARQLWQVDQPTFLAKRHFLVRDKISCIQGQDLWPGTRIRYTNRKVISPTGADGVINALGLVLSSSLSPDEHAYDVEILIFADQFAGQIRLFSPIAKIANPWAGGSTTVPLHEDYFGHGGSADGPRFLEPSWSSIGGQLRVGVLWYDRTGWTFDSMSGSRSVTAASDTTVTLSSAAPTFHRDTHKYLIALPYDSQDAGEWPRELLLPLVLDDHTFGSGPTTGWPLLQG